MTYDQCARRAIAEAKQGWSVIEWVTKNLLSRYLRNSSRTPTFYQNYLAMRNSADVTVS
jgi:hypothetical protein